ncbi:hypothetical protein WH47_08037, partial [Habropoda laboriosa]
PSLFTLSHRPPFLPAKLPTAKRTGGCKWYIHYFPQSNGWNLLGDKLLRLPALLAEFQDSIRPEVESDTFSGCFSTLRSVTFPSLRRHHPVSPYFEERRSSPQ